MFNLRTWFSKIHPVLTPLERRVLSALEGHLAPDGWKLLSRQVEKINLAQCHAGGREVCYYHMRRGKLDNDPLLQFPARDPELKFASIRFRLPDAPTTYTAEFFLVRGFFFSISFNRPTRAIQNRTDVHVLEVAVHARFTAISPSKFSSLASISVSKPCSVEVKAAPRSQFLFEPIKRKVGSADTRTASLRSS